MLAIARERYGHLSGVRFQKGDVTNIALPDSSVDCAFAMRTVQYVNDPPVAIRELTRVTRPGGRVVLVEGGSPTPTYPTANCGAGLSGPDQGLEFAYRD